MFKYCSNKACPRSDLIDELTQTKLQSLAQRKNFKQSFKLHLRNYFPFAEVCVGYQKRRSSDSWTGRKLVNYL